MAGLDRKLKALDDVLASLGDALRGKADASKALTAEGLAHFAGELRSDFDCRAAEAPTHRPCQYLASMTVAHHRFHGGRAVVRYMCRFEVCCRHSRERSLLMFATRPHRLVSL